MAKEKVSSLSHTWHSAVDHTFCGIMIYYYVTISIFIMLLFYSILNLSSLYATLFLPFLFNLFLLIFPVLFNLFNFFLQYASIFLVYFCILWHCLIFCLFVYFIIGWLCDRTPAGTLALACVFCAEVDEAKESASVRGSVNFFPNAQGCCPKSHPITEFINGVPVFSSNLQEHASDVMCYCDFNCRL